MRRELLATFAVTLVACGTPATTTDAGTDAGTTTPLADAGVGDAGTLVGTFTLLHKLADSSASLYGKVYDGPTPATLVWETALTDGDCVLQTPRVPFCTTACGSTAVCVENETCQSYPTSKSVGTVHASGIVTTSGVVAFDMTPVVNGYQPTTVSLAVPPFTDGSALTLTADGSSALAGFTLGSQGVAPLTLTSTTLALASGADLPLTWTPGASSTAARIKVKLDISHHGGTRGQILCDTDDDGALTLSAALVTRLIDLGVAGFPTIIVRRAKTGSTVIAPGRVDFVVGSEVETAVTVPGLVSCTDDTECTAPATCQSDLTCK